MGKPGILQRRSTVEKKTVLALSQTGQRGDTASTKGQNQSEAFGLRNCFEIFGTVIALLEIWTLKVVAHLCGEVRFFATC